MSVVVTGASGRLGRRTVEASLRRGVPAMSHADTATTILAATHRATEEYLRERQVPGVLLRNSWCLENYTVQLPAPTTPRPPRSC